MRILIADDERRIREGLVRHISKMEGNYYVEGVFSNGKELLKYMEQHEADIVITDIRMPLMDGMAVSGEIRSRWPMTKVIILSGYCEFEYAKTSIQYGVSDFLVKPVKPDELKKTLEKVSRELKQCWQERWEQHQQEQIVNQYRRQIIRAWLNDSIDIVETRKTHFFSDRMQAYRVIYSEGNSDALIRLIQELPYASCTVQCYNLAAGKDCIFLEYGDAGETDYIIDNLMLPDNCCITAGVSGLRNDESELSGACREALNACKRSWYCEGNLFYAEKLLGIETLDFPRQIVEEAVAGVFSCDEEICSSGLEAVKYEVWERRMDALHLRNMLFQMIQKVSRESERLGLRDSDQGWRELFEVLTFDSFDGVFLKIKDYFFHIQKELKQILSYRNGKKISEVISYINEHLNEDIALQDACDHVGISAGYLSRTFKEKTGFNFVDYVNRQKIEQAKKMLTEGEMTSAEIAKALAFNDDKYFIRLFKKMVGMTPGTYRKVSR